MYFAVAKQGAKPEDGKTDTNPEGLTAAWGLHADAVASRLHANDLACKVLALWPNSQCHTHLSSVPHMLPWWCLLSELASATDISSTIADLVLNLAALPAIA